MHIKSGLPAALFLAFITALAGWTQSTNPPAAPDPAMEEFILAPVVVLDNAGKPARGLKPADFVLHSDGKPQTIRIFQEVSDPGKPEPPPQSASSTPTSNLKISSVPDGGMPQQLLIIAIDLVNTGFLGRGEAQQELLQYVADNLPERPFELLAITRDGVVQIHSFASDPTATAQALRRAAATLGKGEEVQQDALATAPNEYFRLTLALRQQPIYSIYRWEIAARGTLTALQQIVDIYAGVPGRKSVVWLTAGVRVIAANPESTGLRSGDFQFQTKSPLKTDPQLKSAYDSAFRALNTADVLVYPIDLKEMKGGKIFLANSAGPLTGSDGSYAVRYSSNRDPNDGIKLLASETGGRTCSVAASLKSCLNLIDEDNASYYLLGFNVPAQSRRSGWHKLDITTTTAGQNVRSRSRYFVPTTRTPADEEIRNYMMTAAKANTSYGGLAFTVERLPDSPRPSEDPINLRIRVPAASVLWPPSSKLSYQIATVALSETGEAVNAVQVAPFNLTAAATQEALNKGWRIDESWPELNFMTGIRFVIRDNATGRIGSVTIPLTGNSGPGKEATTLTPSRPAVPPK